MNNQPIYLHEKLQTFLALVSENEIVEFKEAKNTYDFNKLGKYFSALSNEANLNHQSSAWLLFGVADNRQVVGTKFRLVRKDLDSLRGCLKSQKRVKFYAKRLTMIRIVAK